MSVSLLEFQVGEFHVIFILRGIVTSMLRVI